MTNYLCRFPDGTAGLGLLVVRTCYALAAFGVTALLPPLAIGATMLRVAAGVLALLLVTGFATRVAALVMGAAVLFALPSSATLNQLLLAGHVGGCAAIALLGPGAYSLDARRHGHRVIHLRTRTPDRGGGD
jgi:hypothetical protein